VRAAAQALAAAARANLPGSDAKEGPLKDLTASGKAFPTTLAKGMLAEGGRVQKAAATLAKMSAIDERANYRANTIAGSLGAQAHGMVCICPESLKKLAALIAGGGAGTGGGAIGGRNGGMADLTYRGGPKEDAVARDLSRGIRNKLIKEDRNESSFGKTIESIINIYNPVGEPSERSLNKVMRRNAYLGEQPPISII